MLKVSPKLLVNTVVTESCVFLYLCLRTFIPIVTVLLSIIYIISIKVNLLVVINKGEASDKKKKKKKAIEKSKIWRYSKEKDAVVVCLSKYRMFEYIVCVIIVKEKQSPA